MKISIVICTFQRADDLRRLLDSVVQQTFLPHEVVIVDQSDDGQTKRLSEEFARHHSSVDRWIYVHQQEKSLVKARNRGVLETSGDVVSFVDDDVVLFNDYLEVVARYLRDPSIGGVTGNVVVSRPLRDWKWELRKFILRIFLLNSFDGRMTASGFGYPIFEREVAELIELELFSGSSMSFRRGLALQEPSDEWFTGYSFREDVDLSYRISRRARLIIVPDARFYHNHSSANRLGVRELKVMQFSNYVYLFKKFRPQSLFYKFLFAYSVSGLVLIDLLEFLLNRNRVKWDAVTGDIKAIFGWRFRRETS